VTTPEQARQEQLAFGRRTLRTSQEYSDRPSTAVRPQERSYTTNRTVTPQRPNTGGHDVILKAMQQNGQRVTIITSGGGDVFEGVITGRDKFTITLKTKHPDPTREGTILRVFYKSAIEQFWGEQVRRDITDTTRDDEGFAELKRLSTSTVQ
jgi:sRNA-binding regulator protein Hfq